MRGTQRYALDTNYIQLIDNDKNKGVFIYIDRRPKSLGNIVEFIKSTQPLLHIGVNCDDIV